MQLFRSSWMCVFGALVAGGLLTGCQGFDQAMARISERLDLPSSAPAPAPGTEKPQSQTLGQYEQIVLEQINTIRKQNGLRPLRANAKLNRVARNYSRLMAERNFFSHTGPEGDTVADRVRREGLFYMVVGENLARIGGSPRPAQIAVQGWMKSPGHRENILRKVYDQTGVGAWRNGRTVYFTQVFYTGF